MVAVYRWYGAEGTAAVAMCQNWMTVFGKWFCDDGDSRGKSRGWDVEMGRWSGRTSDMVGSCAWLRSIGVEKKRTSRCLGPRFVTLLAWLF